MLTPDQRQYLRGEKQYNENVEANTRYEIRKRVRNSLVDFALLLDEMEARDREQIFKDIRSATQRDDEHFKDEAYREAELGGLVQTLGFLYLGADDSGIQFEKAVEQGITAARSADASNPFASRSVDVTITEELTTDIDQVVQKIETETPLDELEYFGLLQYVLSDPDAFDQMAAQADIDIEAKLECEKSLTRGESVVAVGKVSHGATIHVDDLLESMHGDVITHLGLSNAQVS